MRARSLILAGFALGALGFGAFALRDPPDSPGHIARECRFIAALEARRMVRSDDYGPAPFEIWRAEERTGGPPRPDRGSTRHLPLEARLLELIAPRDVAPIDCGPAMVATGAPRMIKYNQGASRQIYRHRYSRITFSPGDRYALSRVSSCWSDDNGWDQNSRVWVWRRTGVTWEPISGHLTLLVYDPPRYKPPMRCFTTPEN